MTDLYETLKVRKTASKKAIKTAFRKRAKQAHPDCGGSREEFELLQLAYHVLSDDDRRARYDVTGETDERRQDNVLQETLQTLAACLSAILQNVLSHGKDPAQEDLLVTMREQFGMAKGDLNRRCEDTKRKRDKLARALGRFSTEDGQNYLEDIVRGSVAPLDHQITSIGQEIEKIDRALTMLKKFKYRVDGKTATLRMSFMPNGPVWQVKTS